MGSWGPGIFSDDVASDVRDDWREAIADGLSPQDATDRLVGAHQDAIEDEDDGPKFWLALAASQAASGRLLPWVRDRALGIIEAGGDVAAFSAESPALGRKREAALRKLAADLTGPQRAPTRIVRPKPTESPVAVGDVVRVAADDGSRTALFVVTSLMEGSWPVLAGLVWEGADLPPYADLLSLPLLREVPLSFRDAAPVVSLHVMDGPTRGPRTFANFGRVVASGVARPDAPHLTMKIGPLEPAVSYSTWEGLAAFVGGEWYARCVALTREFHKP